MVADDGELIAGHGRVLAAIMLGLKDVPVIRLTPQPNFNIGRDIPTDNDEDRRTPLKIELWSIYIK